jgi:hypothetical protein
VFNQRESETMENNLPPQFPPLELVTRPTVETAAAAYYLNRRPQTLRIYACHENGPLRPIRVHGRLHWKTDDLRRLLGIRAYGPQAAPQ